MPQETNCPRCGAPIPANAPAGFCPNCLLRAGLQEPTQGLDATLPHSPQSGSDSAATVDSAPATPATPQPGIKLRYLGDYELLAEIARGGMGIVYKARQLSLGRVVALKLILAREFASEAEVQRFHREAEAAAILDHPAIVPVFEIGQQDGVHFLAMGFVEGSNLAAKLAAGPIEPREAASLLQVIAQGVQFAHELGVVHRDLKPANILLDIHGRPRITDFGLAKTASDATGLTATGQVLGTPSYMPPEQAAGQLEAVGPASDVYALGAILYAILSGRPPFQAASTVETLRQVLDREPVSLATLNAAIPRDLETIALKCLEKSIPRRYGTAREVAEELQRYLEGMPILARPVGRTERAWRWARRNPLVASLWASMLVLLVLTAIGSTISAFAINEQRAKAVEAGRNESIQRQAAVREQQRAQTAEQLATDEADRARENLYLAYMNLAQKAWDDTTLSRLRSLLDATRPENMDGKDLRGMEWHYWNRLLHRHRTLFATGSVPVLSLAFSPDGKQLITAAGLPRGEYKIWDAVSGQWIRKLPGFPSDNDVAPMALSRDGKMLVTSAGDTPTTKGRIIVWDVASGEELFRLGDHEGHITGVAISPDGQWIASSAMELAVWNVATRRKKLVLAPGLGVLSLAISPDGKVIAAGTHGRNVMLWDLESGKELHKSRDFLHGVLQIAFSPNSQRVACGLGGGMLVVLEAPSGRIVFEQEAHSLDITGLAYRPGQPQLVSCAQDEMIRFWSADDGRPLFHIKAGEPLKSCAFTLDGMQIVTGNQSGGVRFWDAAPVQDAVTLLAGSTTDAPAHHIGVCFRPDGNQLAASAGEGRGRSGRFSLFQWPDRALQHNIKAQAWPVSKIDYSRDSALVVTVEIILHHSEKPCEVNVWDAHSGRRRFSLAHPKMVTEAVFDPTGQYLATACHDGIVRLFDAREGLLVRSIVDEAGPVEEVAFSHDGRKLAISTHSRHVRIFNAETGAHLLDLAKVREISTTRAIAFNRAGTHLAGASRSAGTLIWNLSTGQIEHRLLGHRGYTRDIVYSHDDRRLITAGDDGTLKVWDVRSGQEVLMLRGHDDSVMGLSLHPDGLQLASASVDGAVKVWNFTPPADEPARSPPLKQPEQVAQVDVGIDEQRVAHLKSEVEAFHMLLKRRPQAPYLRLGLGMALLELNRPQEAADFLNLALAQRGHNPYQRGQLAALLIKQPNLELFQRLLVEGTDYENLSDLAYHAAAQSLLAYQMDKYEEVRRTMISFHRKLALQGRGVPEIRACTLTAVPDDIQPDLAALAENVMKESGANITSQYFNPSQLMALHCVALVHLRAGRPAEAIRHAAAGLKNNSVPQMQHLVLALAHHALGQAKEAKSHLQQAALEPSDSVNAHAHRVLFREARSLIEPSPAGN